MEKILIEYSQHELLLLVSSCLLLFSAAVALLNFSWLNRFLVMFCHAGIHTYFSSTVFKLVLWPFPLAAFLTYPISHLGWKSSLTFVLVNTPFLALFLYTLIVGTNAAYILAAFMILFLVVVSFGCIVSLIKGEVINLPPGAPSLTK